MTQARIRNIKFYVPTEKDNESGIRTSLEILFDIYNIKEYTIDIYRLRNYNKVQAVEIRYHDRLDSAFESKVFKVMATFCFDFHITEEPMAYLHPNLQGLKLK